MRKSTMSEDIKKYPIYTVIKGKLIKLNNIKSTADYNHYSHNLHHFIPGQQYEKNKSWFKERGVEQKLLLIPIAMHEHIHNQGVFILSDDDFEVCYKISRWDLIFNRKYSKY